MPGRSIWQRYSYAWITLAFFLYVGSPQSKEGDDRMEAKIDALLLQIDPEGGERLIRELDEAYAGRHTDARLTHR